MRPGRWPECGFHRTTSPVFRLGKNSSDVPSVAASGDLAHEGEVHAGTGQMVVQPAAISVVIRLGAIDQLAALARLQTVRATPTLLARRCKPRLSAGRHFHRLPTIYMSSKEHPQNTFSHLRTGSGQSEYLFSPQHRVDRPIICRLETDGQVRNKLSD